MKHHYFYTLLSFLIIFLETHGLKIEKSRSLTKSKSKQEEDDFVNVIPEEIPEPVPLVVEAVPQHYHLYDSNKFQADLDSERIKEYPNQRHNGHVYYKDERPYYGPKITYNNIPEPDIKFSTPVLIGNLDDEMKSRRELQEELIEAEKQLSNLLLFTQEAKNVRSETKNLKVNDKYALPYYDSTKLDKKLQLDALTKRIWYLKDKLKLDHEIKVFVTVNNRTFPHHADDLAKRYNESYAVYNRNYKPNETLVNGNFTNIDDVYNIRKHLLQSKADVLRNSLGSINSEFAKLPMFQKHLESKNVDVNKQKPIENSNSKQQSYRKPATPSDSDLDDLDSI